MDEKEEEEQKDGRGGGGGQRWTRGRRNRMNTVSPLEFANRSSTRAVIPECVVRVRLSGGEGRFVKMKCRAEWLCQRAAYIDLIVCEETVERKKHKA